MDKLYAALIFFTRLPVWKFTDPSRDAFKDVVIFWPYVGWLSGGLMAIILKGGLFVFPGIVTIILALTCRIMLTGALHEDGMADFCDGFGCGGDKTRILTIMKDSHIGTYGVIGLILYFVTIISALMSLPVTVAVWGVVAADAFSKFCAAQITNLLPYARPEGAKNGILYSRMSIGKWIVCMAGGAIPLGIAAYFIGVDMLFAALPPIFIMLALVVRMRRQIGGYTGDCCGATFIICELSFLLTLTIFY